MIKNLPKLSKFIAVIVGSMLSLVMLSFASGAYAGGESQMTDAEKVELARRLFVEGWGGATPQAPLQFLTEDVVMRDIVGHAEPLRGHEAVVNFWGHVAGDLRVPPEEFFVSEHGVALTWMAYVRITDDSQGPENKGKWLCGEGMSRLEFRDRKVSLEIDYWHGPQGICDDWEGHFKARQAMSRAERGATAGAVK